MDKYSSINSLNSEKHYQSTLAYDNLSFSNENSIKYSSYQVQPNLHHHNHFQQQQQQQSIDNLDNIDLNELLGNEENFSNYPLYNSSISPLDIFNDIKNSVAFFNNTNNINKAESAYADNKFIGGTTCESSPSYSSPEALVINEYSPDTDSSPAQSIQSSDKSHSPSVGSYFHLNPARRKRCQDSPSDSSRSEKRLHCNEPVLDTAPLNSMSNSDHEDNESRNSIEIKEEKQLFNVSSDSFGFNCSEKKSNKNISFNNWNMSEWAELYSDTFEKINAPKFRVEADKGFFYSQFDEAFVCQKKNHFQVTTHTVLSKIPAYCKTRSEKDLQQIEKFQLQLYGIKEESPMQQVPIKQSDSDRKPIDYEPVECKFEPNQPTKITKMRLHFAHTTNNNNRKRNKPNPDQRYFLLVVEMQIVTKSGRSYTLCSSISEKVIVRAVNPGQFKQEACEEANGAGTAAAGATQVSNNVTPAVIAHNLKPNEQNVYIFGKMGINTTQPEEALSVVGNVKLTGNILQPSDVRVKENFERVDANQALENVSKLKLFRYDYKPEFVEINGGVVSDYGVLAQDVQKIIPDAVVESGNLVLANGQVVENFLHVNKNRLHMECVGAVIALGDKTQHLDAKIVKLEEFIVNAAGEKVKLEANESKEAADVLAKTLVSNVKKCKVQPKWCSVRTFKIIMLISLLIIAFGVAGILIVQILQHNKAAQIAPTTKSPTDPSNSENASFFYPKINPPPISIVCNKTAQLCKFCCQGSNSKSATISEDNISLNESLGSFDLRKVSESYMNDTAGKLSINSNSNSEGSKISGIYLSSVNPYIYLNLTSDGSCPRPYCEEVNDIYYFFVPIDKNVNIKLTFYLLFYTSHGYKMKSCNLVNNGMLCPSLNIDTVSFDDYDAMEYDSDGSASADSNPSLMNAKQQITGATQYIYFAPISYFLHVDFAFRVYADNADTINGDVCSMKKAHSITRIFSTKKLFYDFIEFVCSETT